ncbi:MAG: hypothetical protein M3O41_19185 [Pseudomonadota bacterium]|nr:hypothetical protein [Pseudomonadota bacterium]
MQMIFYPGFWGHVAQAEYAVVRREEKGTLYADIVVINSRRAGLDCTSLWTTDEGRDAVLNKILGADLLGVCLKYVRFFVLIDPGAHDRIHCVEVPIRLDVDDYREKGNRYWVKREAYPSRLGRLLYWVGIGQKLYCWRDSDVVGGCAKFHAPFTGYRAPPPEEIQALCAAVGYQGRRQGLPAWLTQGLWGDPNPVLND